MAKRKRKSRRRKRIAQSVAALKQNGLKSFNQCDYSQAIATWERISQTMRPVSALAEAYFRRGLSRFYRQQPNIETGLGDLQQASDYCPDDPCYAYHLGLAHHRQGNLNQAINYYRIARGDKGKFAVRAAYPLALALYQHNDDLTNTTLWSDLNAEERSILHHAATFQRRPYTLTDDAPSLWQGLVALDSGNYSLAHSALKKTLESTTDPIEEGITHYYLGTLAAQAEDWDDARYHWTAAYANGMRTPRLNANLGELFLRLAEEQLMSGDVHTALAATVEAERHKPDDKQLVKLLSQIHQQLGYKAAIANQLEKARSHWEIANEIEHGSFRLAYNRALVYELSEDFILAGETWREVLRRRPRRADHPDAINDQQVARLWQRAAEAYRKEGLYDESIKVYRQAIKRNPASTEIRLALAEELLSAGRLQAAENELNRILEHDPNNIPTLLRLGEVVFQNENWWRSFQASKFWQRVLELQPDNFQAKQLLSDFYLDQAEIDYSWDSFAEAIDNYKKALEYQPKNSWVLAAVGGCYLRLGDKAVAQSYMDDALLKAPSDLDVVNEIITAFVDIGDPDQAWSMMERAETTIQSIPYDFYVAQATKLLRSLPANSRREMVEPWLERAVAKAPPGESALLMIGEIAMALDAEISRQYLEKAVASGQEPGQAHLILGILAAKEDDDLKKANWHWKKVEKIARQNRDDDLAERVAMARFMFSPQSFIDALFGGRIGPLPPIPFP